MTRFLTAAAITALIAAPALADSQSDDSDHAKMIRARDLLGAEIYTLNAEGTATWDAEATYDQVSGDWSDIGEVEDIVLGEDGQMIGVVAEVGGFLDIGDKHVFLETESIKLVPVDDKSYGIVTGASREQLMQSEGVDEGFWN